MQSNSSTPLHTGHFISINVSGGSTVSSKATVEQAHEAVINAYQQALQRNKSPGAILLQEYSWANSSLKKLIDQLEKISGHDWMLIRIWQDSPKERDTALVYNTSIYKDGTQMTGNTVQKSENIPEQLRSYLPSEILADTISYDTRWCGVHLTCTDHHPYLQFLLISYHGRSNRRKHKKDKDASDRKNGCVPLQAHQKCVLSKDFVTQVARVGINTLPKRHVDNHGMTYIPAIIAGDWNSDAQGSFESFSGLAFGTAKWSCNCHVPFIQNLAHSMRVTEDLIPKEFIDYTVTVNYDNDRGFARVDVLESIALVHSQVHRKAKLFDHDPVLVTFTVRKAAIIDVVASTAHSDGTVVGPGDARVPQRVAASVARGKIQSQLAAVSGRRPGKEMKKISEESPPPSFIVRYNHHEDDGDVQAAVGEETKGNDANNEIKGDTAHAAKHHRHKAKPPRFLLYRTERKYLTMQVSELKKTKLKDVVFDMARDVMQVEPHRHLDYDMAQNEYWWPSGVRTRAEFLAMSEDSYRELFVTLQTLLRKHGKDLPPGMRSEVESSGNQGITTAAASMVKAFARMMSGHHGGSRRSAGMPTKI